MNSGSRPANDSSARGISIRRAEQSDAASISFLLKRAFAEFEPLYTPEAFLATVLPVSGVLQRMEEGPVWIAESERGVIGTVSAMCLSNSVMIRGMAVDPEAQGQRLGRTLLCVTQDFACAQRSDRMSLYTTAFLSSAIRLYQSFEFRFSGQQINPHGTELLHMVKEMRDVSNLPR